LAVLQEQQLWEIQKVMLKLLQWLLCRVIQDLFILCGKSKRSALAPEKQQKTLQQQTEEA
jgi:hypothetical protein